MAAVAWQLCCFLLIIASCSHKEVRYSCLHLDLKCSRVKSCHLAMCFMVDSSLKFESSTSSSSTASFGSEVILLPHSRWAGVWASTSSKSDGVYVKCLSFNIAYTSITRVSRTVSDTWALPKVFFKAVFVRPINPPPYWGTCLGMNFQITPYLLEDSINVVPINLRLVF